MNTRRVELPLTMHGWRERNHIRKCGKDARVKRRLEKATPNLCAIHKESGKAGAGVRSHVERYVAELARKQLCLPNQAKIIPPAEARCRTPEGKRVTGRYDIFSRLNIEGGWVLRNRERFRKRWGALLYAHSSTKNKSARVDGRLSSNKNAIRSIAIPWKRSRRRYSLS